VTPRARIFAFGSAGALIAAGIVCALVFGGVLGPVLAFVLIGVGFVLATSLVFLEVGLSEDRERAREGARAQRSERPRRLPVTGMRSHRRRLM
jgi:hypothetical protein